MKLTADLLSNSVSQINALGDRELVLRGMLVMMMVKARVYSSYLLHATLGLKIPAIENLGVTKVNSHCLSMVMWSQYLC